MIKRRHAALSLRCCRATYRRSHAHLILLLIFSIINSVLVFLGGHTVYAEVAHQGAPPVYLPLINKVTPGRVIQQGYFYDVGRTSTSMIASKASIVILPRGKTKLREELRAKGFTGKALQYFLANEVVGPGPYADASARCDTSFTPYVLNHVAFQPGDFCSFIHPNESWFLHNSKGQRLYSRHNDGFAYHMNPANPGWRTFALQRMVRDLFGDSIQARLGWDGIFLDNTALGLYKLQHQLVNSDGAVKEYTSNSAYRREVQTYLAQLSATLRPRALLWANLIDDWNVVPADYLPYVESLDGYMNEAWALGYEQYPLNPQQWNNVLSIAETALAKGKGVLTVVQGAQGNTTRQQFGLASYLLVTNSSTAYFRYANSNNYGDWWQYDNYSVELGAPKGSRYQISSGWRRDFACGYVIADPVARTGKIVQSGCGK